MQDVLSRREGIHFQVHGRRGQRQLGVDLFGTRPDGALFGVQCKNVASLSLQQILKEVELAEGFEPPLERFCVVTSVDADAHLHREIRLLSEDRRSKALFRVDVLFWQDIEHALSGHADLVVKHFPSLATGDVSEGSRREVERRALLLIRAANKSARESEGRSGLPLISIALVDDLDFEAAYLLAGDPRVEGAVVDEVRRVVSIAVNRLGIPLTLIRERDRGPWPFDQ